LWHVPRPQVRIDKKGSDTMNKLLEKLLPLILSVMSPEIKKAVAGFVQQLDEQAKKTPNPWDDMFVAILKSIIRTD